MPGCSAARAIPVRTVVCGGSVVVEAGRHVARHGRSASDFARATMRRLAGDERGPAARAGRLSSPAAAAASAAPSRCCSPRPAPTSPSATWTTRRRPRPWSQAVDRAAAGAASRWRWTSPTLPRLRAFAAAARGRARALRHPGEQCRHQHPRPLRDASPRRSSTA